MRWLRAFFFSFFTITWSLEVGHGWLKENSLLDIQQFSLLYLLREMKQNNNMSPKE